MSSPQLELQFGPFAAAFESTGLEVPGHLTLLNLQNDDAEIVISRIAEALRTNEAQKWVNALFQDLNWRPHLVGAVAILLDQRARLDPAPLWGAIDRGSWVTPQLIVTALFSDAAFVSRATDRMNRACPVAVPPALDPLLRHVATGPAAAPRRSGKMAASILAVCPRLVPLATRESTWRADPQIQSLLAEDRAWDNSEKITHRWLEAITRRVAKQGIVLSPPDAT